MKQTGSRWWKFDFHTHTPASADYRGDKRIYPLQWLQGYHEKGIQCVVVTDHNSGAWVDVLKTQLNELKSEIPDSWADFAIFPGMEISCSSGVHLLAILDPSKRTADIDALRGLVQYSGTAGDSDGVTQLSVDACIDAIHKFGGLAIAAHIDKPKGLLTAITDFNTLTPILEKLDALEIIDGTSTICSSHHAKINALASVLGSDSHAPAEIGKGFTWVKMSSPSIEGLRLALLDPNSAIKRKDADGGEKYPQSLSHPQIKSITIDKLQLRQSDELTINFNPSYNAFIGGRGSGKSTILECLRLALARDNELLELSDGHQLRASFENFKKECSGRKQPGMMLNNSRIHAVVSKGIGESEELFEYRWQKNDNGKFGVSVYRFDANELFSVNGAWIPTELTEEQARDNFPVKIFSQKQILSLADNPQSLLQYIDSVLGVDKTNWARSFEEKSEALHTARKKVRTLKAKIAEKPVIELQHAEASRKAAAFANSNIGAILPTYKRSVAQRAAVDGFFKQIEESFSVFANAVSENISTKTVSLQNFDATSESEIALKAGLDAFANSIVVEIEKIKSSIAETKQKISLAKSNQEVLAWNAENQKLIENYNNLINELKAEGITSSAEAANAVNTETQAKVKLEEIALQELELIEAQNAVNILQENLNCERYKLTEIRQSLVNKILEGDDNKLKITIHSMSDIDDAVLSLREVLKIYGDGTFSKDFLGEKEDTPTTPCGIVWDIINPNDTTSSLLSRLIDAKTALENNQSKVLNTTLHGKLVNQLKERNADVFDALASWFPEDSIELEYRRDKHSSFQSLQQASAGQKTAAILSFLLAHGDEPLLMDQPEDDLDNALVSELVVTQLRNNKARRQLIIITHNANIVVNGDAELVIPMEFVKGQIVNKSNGGLQEKVIREKICEIMEGGKPAFELRYKRILRDLEKAV